MKILDSEIIKIEADINGHRVELELILQIDDDNYCILITELPDGTKIESRKTDFFDCLVEVRTQYPDIKFLCKGAKINVYPSRMGRQMSHGKVSYEMTLGESATRENLVRTFDFECEGITTPAIQKEFFYQWLESLKGTRINSANDSV